MSKPTALEPQHLLQNGKMVDFAGWSMPIHYGSQLEEHHQVRRDAGMFDVSHMTVVDLHGSQVGDFLRHLLANDIDKLSQAGKALYSCMLNDEGGVIDDLIVYYLSDDWYRMVVNAGTHDKDILWLNKQAADFDLQIKERDDLSMIAVQGPNARAKTLQSLDASYNKIEDLGLFFAHFDQDIFVARTGYTGEDGYELILPHDQATLLWQKLLENGVKPIGLGARDTLRLEAAMNLYGQDMDETTSPLESGLGWTVSLKNTERHFIGRDALEKLKQDGVQSKLVGLILEDKGVLRPGQIVTVPGLANGVITSGGFSPSLGVSIGLARVPVASGNSCQIEIRKRQLNAKIVKAPFVRNGEACYQLLS